MTDTPLQPEPKDDTMTPPTWLGPIRQTAFVVADIEATAREWAEVHGVGPWFLYQVDIADTDYRGSKVPMRARMGLAQTGGQQIELIQPDPDVPSIYREFAEAGGTGVHHVCYWGDVDRLEAQLFREVNSLPNVISNRPIMNVSCSMRNAWEIVYPLA